ncbi:MAG: hypothetical protein ACFB0B_01805 [Thermonemataceae bacterium]
MRRFSLLIIAIIFIGQVKAQNPEKLIAQKWRFKTGAIHLQDKPMSDLPELSPDEEMDDMIGAMQDKRKDMMRNTTFLFKRNGKMIYENEVMARDAEYQYKESSKMFKSRAKVEEKGEWEMSKNGKMLRTTIGRETKQYEVQSLTADKMVLKDEAGQVYVLVPSL